MRKQDSEILKNLLKDGITSLASDDFTERVVAKYLSEQTQAHWKPGYNYTLLFYLVLIGMLLMSIILYLTAIPMNTVFPELPIETIMDKLYLLFLVIVSFSVFTLVSDLIESNILKNTI
ncbi:hypothetical protein JW935_26695 [candidate division KSB1 bacterium]|nr:hypothetical protein [candidate division KSB1 bacterium]